MTDEWLTSSTSDLRGHVRGPSDSPAVEPPAVEPPAVEPPAVEPPAPDEELPRATGTAAVRPEGRHRGNTHDYADALGVAEVHDTRIGWYNDGPERTDDDTPMSRVRRLLRNPRKGS